MSASEILAAFKVIGSSFTNGPIYWPNDRVVPPNPPSLYVWAEVTGLGADLLGSGTLPLSARRGFIRFHIFDAYGSASEGLYAAADVLTALFGAIANAGSVTGLNMMAPTTPEIGAQSDDGLWYGVSISVPWIYWAAATA